MNSGLVGVVLKNIPAGEYQVFQSCQRDEVFDHGRAAIRAFTQAYRAHLSQRSNRLGNTFADSFNTCHKSGGHCAHARNHYSEFSLGGSNTTSLFAAGI